MKHPPTAFIRLCLVSLAAAFAAQTALGQVSVRKQPNPGEISPLDISGFTAGQGISEALFRKTLEEDLLRSGWFAIIRSGRGEFAVTGSAEANGADLAVKCEVFEVFTRDRLLGKTYGARAGEARRLAHKVADEIVLAITGKPGIASSQIALVRARAGKKELYLCDSDGANLRQITRDNTLNLSPKFGPDGKTLIYTTFFSRFPDVCLYDLASGKRTIVASYPGLNACGAISPSGHEIALTLSKGGNPDIFIMEIAGRRLTRLTDTRKYAEASPAWSPDGRRIVFVSDRGGSPQLYVMNRAGGEADRISSLGSENVDPDWGVNGYVACSTKLGGRYQISVINPDTKEVSQITNDGLNYEDPSWAPDGRHLVCTVKRNYQSSLFIIDMMTGVKVALLSDKETGDWSMGDWSP